jgi:preprotein translocase subunit SecF
MSGKTKRKKIKQLFNKRETTTENQIVEKKIDIKPEISREDKNNPFLAKLFSYKYLLIIIPLIFLFISILLIGLKYHNTGEFINRGVSLKGGTTFTISSEQILMVDIEEKIKFNFPHLEVGARALTEGTNQIGLTIETDATENNDINGIITLLKEEYNLNKDQYSVETMGSSLGMSFFKQTMRALILAFIFMAIVVFIYFRIFVPSITVVLATLEDIVITIAILNLLNISLSTAGIAALLMLIGYSVDTNIVLTTKILRSKEGNFYDRYKKAFKTGITMTITTLLVVTTSYFIAESEVIKQIMLIIGVGLLIDIMNTWLQNAAILKIYYDKKIKSE